jgi:hypothetical protein
MLRRQREMLDEMADAAPRERLVRTTDAKNERTDDSPGSLAPEGREPAQLGAVNVHRRVVPAER